VILTYRYRLLPHKSQHRALERLCAAQREMYDAALEERISKPLAVRTHKRPSCGLVIGRDYNSSLNSRRAGVGAWALNVIGCDVRAPGNMC
jgi:transposase